MHCDSPHVLVKLNPAGGGKPGADLHGQRGQGTPPRPQRTSARTRGSTTESERRQLLGLPEENILYFLEKKAPLLKTWQREILRIVRHVAQYFYPQKQTKMMNEGCATFVHYYIMNRLHQTGFLDDGAMLEFFQSHTGAVFQPDFDHRGYSGINPYALGFGMMQDIKRVCENPTEEDRAWLPDIAGSKDWVNVLKDGWANHRDESFIRQFMSPQLIRDMKFFDLHDDSQSDLLVKAIHNERGYQTVRTKLADQYDVNRSSVREAMRRSGASSWDSKLPSPLRASSSRCSASARRS